eukprot:658794-Hanusia_phi.AAC.5
MTRTVSATTEALDSESRGRAHRVRGRPVPVAAPVTWSEMRRKEGDGVALEHLISVNHLVKTSELLQARKSVSE